MASAGNKPLWDKRNPNTQGLFSADLQRADTFRLKNAELCREMNLSEPLWSSMFSYEVVSAEDRDEIKAVTSPALRASRLLVHVSRGPLWRYFGFLKSLIDTEQDFILRCVLSENRDAVEDGTAVVSIVTASPPPPIPAQASANTIELRRWVPKHPDGQKLLTKVQEKKLTKKLTLLGEKVTVDDPFLNYLEGMEIIGVPDKERLEKKDTTAGQMSEIVKLVRKGCQWKFWAFLKVLYETGNEAVVKEVLGEDPSKYLED